MFLPLRATKDSPEASGTSQPETMIQKSQLQGCTISYLLGVGRTALLPEEVFLNDRLNHVLLFLKASMAPHRTQHTMLLSLLWFLLLSPTMSFPGSSQLTSFIPAEFLVFTTLQQSYHGTFLVFKHGSFPIPAGSSILLYIELLAFSETWLKYFFPDT